MIRYFYEKYYFKVKIRSFANFIENLARDCLIGLRIKKKRLYKKDFYQ